MSLATARSQAVLRRSRRRRRRDGRVAGRPARRRRPRLTVATRPARPPPEGDRDRHGRPGGPIRQPVVVDGRTRVVQTVAPRRPACATVWPGWPGSCCSLLGLPLIGLLVVADRLARRITGRSRAGLMPPTGPRPGRPGHAGRAPRARRGARGGGGDQPARRADPRSPGRRAGVGRRLVHRLRHQSPPCGWRSMRCATRGPAAWRRPSASRDHVDASGRPDVPVRHSVVPLVDVLAVAKSRTAFWTPLADDQGEWSRTARLDGLIILAVRSGRPGGGLDALIDNVFAHPGRGRPSVRVESTEPTPCGWCVGTTARARRSRGRDAVRARSARRAKVDLPPPAGQGPGRAPAGPGAAAAPPRSLPASPPRRLAPSLLPPSVPPAPPPRRPHFAPASPRRGAHLLPIEVVDGPVGTDAQGLLGVSSSQVTSS